MINHNKYYNVECEFHSIQRTTVVNDATVTDHTMFGDGVQSAATDLKELKSLPPDAVQIRCRGFVNCDIFLDCSQTIFYFFFGDKPLITAFIAATVVQLNQNLQPTCARRIMHILLIRRTSILEDVSIFIL